MSFLKKWESLTLRLLRCGLGLVFIYHGYPKLIRNTERFVESFQAIGLPRYFVYVAGVIESFGGLAIALGLFTPVVGLAARNGSSDVEIQLQRRHLRGARVRTPLDLGPGVTSARRDRRGHVLSGSPDLPQKGQARDRAC